MSALPPVCILAGGLGSRLGSAVIHTPKPLLEVAGRPFLHHQLDVLAEHGARQIVLCVGYLGGLIRSSVGDGSAFGLRVQYSEDGPHLIGTAGAVRKAIPLLGDPFLVLYGDTFLSIDYRDVVRCAVASSQPALMTVLHNAGHWDASNAEFQDGRVTRYDKARPDERMTYIDYGLSVYTAAAFDHIPADEPDLAELSRTLAEKGLLAGYEATERFYEIGTREGLRETEDFFRGRQAP